MSDDLTLLEKWQHGDATAGRALFERYFDAVYRFFQRKIERGAEDLVQQTFVRAMESAAKFRGDSTMRSYLLAIARNLLVDQFRARGAERFDPELDSLVDLGISPSSWIAEQQRDRLLLAALRELPLAAQTILELYYWEGLAGEEIAVVLDISPHTVRSRLSRARSKLRTAMEMLDGASLHSTRTELEGWAARLAALRSSSAPHSDEALDDDGD